MQYIIYTDGSSTGKQGKAGSAAVIFNGNKGILFAEPLPYICGNNAAELYAIYLAVRYLPKRASAKIHTDSNNAIMWLTGNWNRNNPLIKTIAEDIDCIWKDKDLNLSFVWIRGHSGIRWNVECDKAAKEAKETNQAFRREVVYE